MKVLEKGEGWFLLEHHGKKYIDVSCESGFASYSLLIKINKAEDSLYKKINDSSFKYLAKDIQRSPNLYKQRNIIGKLEKESYDAIIEYNKAST